jgi:hypothetical protein
VWPARSVSGPGKADDDVDGQMRANLMTHLYNFAGTEACRLGVLCEDLKRDHTLKAPKHADMYEFLREAGVKVDGDAAKSLGRYLKKHDGEVCTVGDKKLQLKTGRDMGVAGCGLLRFSGSVWFASHFVVARPVLTASSKRLARRRRVPFCLLHFPLPRPSLPRNRSYITRR